MTKDEILRWKSEATKVIEPDDPDYRHERCAKLCEAYAAPGIGREMAEALRAGGLDF
jgi:hypothetical protein